MAFVDVCLCVRLVLRQGGLLPRPSACTYPYAQALLGFNLGCLFVVECWELFTCSTYSFQKSYHIIFTRCLTCYLCVWYTHGCLCACTCVEGNQRLASGIFLYQSPLEPVSSGDHPSLASLVLACGRCLYLLRLLSLTLVTLTNFMCIVIIDEYVHIVNQSSELFSTYKTGLCCCWHALHYSLVLEFEPVTSCMLDKNN